MSGNLELDPDRLRAVAPRFTDIADSISNILGQLTDALAAEGESWGRDENGTSFGSGYAPAAKAAASATETIRDAMNGVHEVALSTADLVDETDHGSAATFGGTS
ncbi:WXG100 family type VII secretion target [Lolliginicoccus suaedae]|uniref:WXG100 family type VII secretion target n=1 Tax=Lolliginicoccus suaedae TaxID=2605429 RepID=UPI0011EF7A9E|nr:type VII secretion target [Lolliginicoccus suaedae]